MTQTATALRILYRHEKGVVAELERQCGPNMEPQVKALYEQKKAAAAALEAKIKGAPV